MFTGVRGSCDRVVTGGGRAGEGEKESELWGDLVVFLVN